MKLKEKVEGKKRRRETQLERINYFSLADKSFPDLLCSTFFPKKKTLGRDAIYFKVLKNIYLVEGDEERFSSFASKDYK